MCVLLRKKVTCRLDQPDKDSVRDGRILGKLDRRDKADSSPASHQPSLHALLENIHELCRNATQATRPGQVFPGKRSEAYAAPIVPIRSLYREQDLRGIIAHRPSQPARKRFRTNLILFLEKEIRNDPVESFSLSRAPVARSKSKAAIRSSQFDSEGL